MRCLLDLGRAPVPMVRRWKLTGYSWEQIFVSLCEIQAGIFLKFLHSYPDNHDSTIALYLSNTANLGAIALIRQHIIISSDFKLGASCLTRHMAVYRVREGFFLSKFAINISKHLS
jgi:hypothetical protein